ncbi:MAG TPA: hypothetical protein DCM45_01125 [Clostridiales bacterium]|nr:hypothetical protein [Clostridiales bacterium]
MDSRELSRDPKISAYMAAVSAVNTDQRRGTGFNIDPSGLIITNYHIVEDVGLINLRLRSGEQYHTSEWLSLPESDLTFIDIEAESLPYLTLAQNQLPQPDDPVIIIGNPLGFFLIVGRATVIGTARVAGLGAPVLVIKGPVYKGHSGSPVINSEGQVIGIIFAAATETTGDETIAYAISAEEIFRQLEENIINTSLPAK